MKKTYLGIGIGIGLILGIGTYLITTSEPTACECASFFPDPVSNPNKGLKKSAKIEEPEEVKKMRYKCKHKYLGSEQWFNQAVEECWIERLAA